MDIVIIINLVNNIVANFNVDLLTLSLNWSIQHLFIWLLLSNFDETVDGRKKQFIEGIPLKQLQELITMPKLTSNKLAISKPDVFFFNYFIQIS